MEQEVPPRVAPPGSVGRLVGRVDHPDVNATFPAVVHLVPTDRVPVDPPAVGTLDQIDTEFVPHVLVVPAPARVRFPNSDVIRHNVGARETAKPFEFNLRPGEERSMSFEEPGVFHLTCSYHSSMSGYIVVVPSPHFTVTVGDEGGFRIDGIPPGVHRVRVWHERWAGRTVEVTIEAGVEANVVIEAV